jgi:cytochrome c oxidase subunit 4
MKNATSATPGVHVVSVRLLGTVLIALLAMTWLTVAVTRFELGNLNLWTAMAIATVKATLVALYFMHLRWERPVNAIFFIGSLLFVAIFVGLALMDTRQYQDALIPGYAPELRP